LHFPEAMPPLSPATTDASRTSVGEWRELSPRLSRARRHPRFVRIGHWITAACVGALFVSGLAILVAHPRLYWGEVGGFGGPSLLDLPMRRVSLGAGWPRSLHFLAAWVIVATGAAYVFAGVITGHFRRRLLPADGRSPYNKQQRLAYLSIVFGLFPLIIWTGLAMSPALTSTFPFLVTLAGGQQSARTMHFIASGGLLLFVGGHIVMVGRSGFRQRVGAMITDSAPPDDARDLVLPGRRRLIFAGVGVAAAGVPLGVAALKRAGLIPPDAAGLLGVGDTITYATHRGLTSTGSLAREFRRSDISAVAPINGLPPTTATYQRLRAGNFAEWRLAIEGMVARPVEFALGDLKQFRPTTQITHLACEEGWSYIAEWTGVRLASLLNEVGISAQARYVVFFAFDRSWNSLDMADAMHRQTLLAYGMNGSDLTAGHGAPLRLHIPRQLGYKQTKYLTRIIVVDDLDAIRNGLGAAAPESGYSWYAGI
jgi:DMSO/TMAO reductase YedYZ molybdopterin-dependent catalytic subunit/thiosulfate reductase cytochrome b subunit